MALHFDDPKKQAKLEHPLTPDANKALHEAPQCGGSVKGGQCPADLEGNGRSARMASPIADCSTI